MLKHWDNTLNTSALFLNLWLYCRENSITACTCPRHFSDLDASWGWDSDLNVYYYIHM